MSKEASGRESKRGYSGEGTKLKISTYQIETEKIDKLCLILASLMFLASIFFYMQGSVSINPITKLNYINPNDHLDYSFFVSLSGAIIFLSAAFQPSVERTTGRDQSQIEFEFNQKLIEEGRQGLVARPARIGIIGARERRRRRHRQGSKGAD